MARILQKAYDRRRKMLERQPEAPLVPSEDTGLVPDGPGWFVVNVAEARAYHTELFGDAVRFEGEDRFPEFAINVRVLQPGQPNALYHREDAQETFLVLKGECLAIIEEEERPLQAGDFIYTPAGTAHVFVGSGEGPCVVLMVGARKAERPVLYPVSEVAAKYGASVERETSSPEEAYTSTGRWAGARRSAVETTLGPII
jgi:uncharacterized cupin superfamily protein